MVSSAWTITTSGDWGTAGNWSGGVPDSVTTEATIFEPAAFTVTIGVAESFTVDTVYAPYGGSFLPTVDVAGSLTIAESTGSSEIGDLTIGALGQVDLVSTGGTEAVNSQQTLENDGTLIASGTYGTAFVLSGGTNFTNNGTVEVTGGTFLQIEPAGLLTNLSASGTLTGGTYIASGNGGGLFFVPITGLTPITTDAATLELDGLGTSIFGYSTTNGQTDIQTSLTSIAAGGVLSVLGGRGYSGTTSITDAGLLDFEGGTLTATSFTLAAGGTLEGFGTIEPSVHGGGGTVIAAGGTLTVSAPVASLTAEAGGVLALSGTYTGPITDNGAVAVMQGTLTLLGSIAGTGSLFVEGQIQNNPTAVGDALMTASVAPTLDLGTSFGGVIRFNGQAAELKLADPATFTGSIVGFGAGDTLDIAGVTNATATLTPDGTITLLSVSGTGGSDTITLDGTGYGGASAVNDSGSGSNITVTGPVPQDYELEPFHWASKVITWAFATTNYSQDSTTPFSGAITASQSLEQQAVENAFSAWAAVSGLTFEPVSDTTNPADAPDIRIGWGDLASGGELGQASYTYFGDLAESDEIIRLQDPAQSNYGLSGSSPSGLVYDGTSSNFEAVVIHEIGHDLGLFHSTDTLAVMYPVASNVNAGISASDIAAIQALYGAPACFASGTKLLTSAGPRPVEALCVGETMVTASGRLARVRWIGHRRLATATHPRPFDVMPVRVREGALGENLPLEDLVLSPDHAVFVDGALVPIRHLVNGRSIRQENRAEVTYWHVELDRHDLVLAEGMACESYLDTGNRAAFAGEAAMQLHPEFATATALAEWDARGCAAILTDAAAPALRSLHLRLLARARPDRLFSFRSA
jgi:hypothetical protein